MTDQPLPPIEPDAVLEERSWSPGPGPRQRTWRTAVQAALAFLGAIPAAHLALTTAGVELAPRTTALVLGVPAALVVLISAVWNTVDQRKGNG